MRVNRLRIADCGFGIAWGLVFRKSAISIPQSEINMPDWKQEIRRQLAGEQLEPTREAASVEGGRRRAST